MERAWITVTALLALSLAGCLSDDEGPTEPMDGGDTGPVEAAYEAFIVEPAVHQGHGLYEPTIDVASDGTIYISSHSTGVGVGPSPGYVSTDDGRTWLNLATASQAQNPAPGQTAGPFFSDEIFIVAGEGGEAGQAWGVDINLHDYIVAGWCDNGADMCYYNPAAYDNVRTAQQLGDCLPIPLKDRPWAAYSNGKLLLVNNPGGGPAQIGVMDVPPPVPVDVGTDVSGIEWNYCASSGGFIPGIPDLRDDGFFAVAQRDGQSFKAVLGNIEDIQTTHEVHVFDATHRAPAESDSTPSEIGYYGQASFDGNGTLYLAAMNNTPEMEGRFIVAYSDDDGATWHNRTFAVDGPISTLYMDGNRGGHGVLVNWGQIDGANTDYYMAHIVVEDGELQLTNVMLAFDDGPEASRHVQGAALGPDGRAYMVMSDISGNDDQAMAAAVGTTPLRVVVQQDGPTLV